MLSSHAPVGGQPSPALAAIASSDSDSRTAIEMELISILHGPAFRGSPRSCDFLRFITEESLAGREESLKERTIGVAVLKRDPGYDTGSDAAVRVRANDVRKRLSAHYEQFAAKAGFRIDLPTGSYIPKFLKKPAAVVPDMCSFAAPAMTLAQLSAPTIVALFLALIAIRVQADAGDGFMQFWSGLLMGRSEISVQLDTAPDGVSVSPALVEAAMPISRVAASFELPFHIMTAQVSPARGQTAGTSACVIRLSTSELPPPGARGERVGDVVLFVVPGSPRRLWIKGETAGSLARAVQTLATREGFPDLH